MRTVPEADDKAAIAALNAEPWMLDLLAINPEYVFWGPHEDYMWKEGNGWDSRVLLAKWSDMWSLDELNECVNFYFSVDRASKPCERCGQSGYNQETRRISDDFYAHSSRSGRGWADQITQDEVQALVDANRLWDFTREYVQGIGWRAKEPFIAPSADEVNEWQRRQMGHDAINRWILIKARAKRLGVYGKCPECDGSGALFTEPSARVTLTLWMLHPRKGCSRGVEIQRVERDDLGAIYAWLREAAKRNAQRFELLPAVDAVDPQGGDGKGWNWRYEQTAAKDMRDDYGA